MGDSPSGGMREAAAEFFGTFILIAFGVGEVAQTVLSKQANGSFLAINLGWGLGVMLAPGNAMPRLGDGADGLIHVRTFEFLLPQAFTVSVYCRSDEESKEVLGVAAAVAKLGRKFFP